LYSRGRDDALLAAPAALRALRAAAEAAQGAEAGWLGRAAEVAEELLAKATGLRERCVALRAERGREYGQSAELFDLAKEYCLLHAVAACLHAHQHAAAATGEDLPSGALLLLQLERLRRQWYPHEAVTDSAVVDDAMRVLHRLYRENRLFSYWQFQLADRTEPIPNDN
jgi:hypothetical protein